MTKAQNIAAIEQATGRSWDEWVEQLNAQDTSKLTHKELAALVNETLSGMTVDSSAWWAQGITVAYEQHIGKRVPGQLANGLFELAVSKVVARPRDEFFPSVVEWFEGQHELNGTAPLKMRSSETPKRSNWRCDFADGSKFAATVEVNGEKSKLVLSHTDVPTQEEHDAWKAYWREVAEALAVANK